MLYHLLLLERCLAIRNILSDCFLLLKVNFLGFYGYKGRRGGFGTAAVYLFYEPTAVAADLTGIVHLFFGWWWVGGSLKNLIASLTPVYSAQRTSTPFIFLLSLSPFWLAGPYVHLSLFCSPPALPRKLRYSWWTQSSCVCCERALYNWSSTPCRPADLDSIYRGRRAAI